MADQVGHDGAGLFWIKCLFLAYYKISLRRFDRKEILHFSDPQYISKNARPEGRGPGAGGRYLTMPLKPMKARARMPTLMMAMGTPLKALGTSLRARCSRMPAKMTMARP